MNEIELASKSLERAPGAAREVAACAACWSVNAVSANLRWPATLPPVCSAKRRRPMAAPAASCLACNWFAQGNHPDFRLLQPEALAEEGEADDGKESKKKPSQQITIEQIRGLDEFLNVGTHRGGLRVVLVHPTEAMNRNSANALLKTLEEPAPSTLFLMVSNEPNRLLPTIRSRCQAMPVPLPASGTRRTLTERSRASPRPVAGWRWLAVRTDAGQPNWRPRGRAFGLTCCAAAWRAGARSRSAGDSGRIRQG